MENQIKITIEGKHKGPISSVAHAILFALNKREEYQKAVIVFNIGSVHPATNCADIVIQTIEI